MRHEIAKTFRAGGNGLGKVLGRLEQEVMEALWKRGETGGKEVFSEIKAHRDIAYTTVLTVLKRLTRKGLVKRKKGETGHVFAPALTKEEFEGMVSREVLKGVIELSGGYAVSSFVDILATRDPGELERLSELIETKKRALERGTRK